MNQSVIRAFDILKSFHHPQEWVTCQELGRRATMHEVAVRRFMPSLVDVGAVVQDEEGRYRCIVFIMLGSQGGRPNAIRRRPRPQLEHRAG